MSAPIFSANFSGSSVPQEQGGQIPPVIETAQLPQVFEARKATIADVDGMSALINEFASARIMLARGPLYLYQSIQDYRVMTMPGGGPDAGREVVVACGGLHVLWEDLAEVRSVAVHPQLQNKGLGGAMVQALIADAKKLGVHHVFTFTLAEGFSATWVFTLSNARPSRRWFGMNAANAPNSTNATKSA